MGSRPRERRYAWRIRDFLFAVPLGLVLVLVSAATSLAVDPTIEAAGGSGPYYWRPSSASIGLGGTVAFKNPSDTVEHGVAWAGGPEAPTCSGVPIDKGKPSWCGSCTFAQAGTYTFYCPIHPEEMKGTVTVTASGTIPPPPPPPPGKSPESPSTGLTLQALQLARSQRGGSVRGSIDLSQAGGRLRVDLLAARAAVLGQSLEGSMRVGHLIRPTLRAGSSSFAVSIAPVARKALRLRKRLALKVTLAVTTPQGDTLKRTRKVTMHG
jgi:plastocyanin